MKYILKRGTAFADNAALMTGIDALTITVEGTAFRFRSMMPFFQKVSCGADEDLKPYIYVECDFKLQSLSSGWDLECITDKGNIALKSFSKSTVAQFTKGTAYSIAGSNAKNIQVIPEFPVLVVGVNTSDGDTIPIQADSFRFYAYENSTPFATTTVSVIQADIIPAMMQANLNEQVQSAILKKAAALSIVQNK